MTDLPLLDLPILTTETIWAVLNDTLDDAIVNQLVWGYLGYQYSAATQSWDSTNVDPIWCNDYPEPPDFIASRPAIVKLTRSIPPANKQLLKEILGFKGYKIGDLNPRLTRRATIANWLLSHIVNHP